VFYIKGVIFYHFISTQQTMGASSSTPLRETQEVEIVFSKAFHGQHTAQWLQQMGRKQVLIKYIEREANRFYHDHKALGVNGRSPAVLYAKLKVNSMDTTKSKLKIRGILHVDKKVLSDKNIDQEGYTDWIGGSNGAFEAPWDDRPYEGIYLQTPEVSYLDLATTVVKTRKMVR
jgi:hypothetical protein